MAKVDVKACTCKHESQDEIYGKGFRLHNVGGGTKTVRTLKCTVCGSKK